MSTTLLDGDCLFTAISCNPQAAPTMGLGPRPLPAHLNFSAAQRGAALLHAADWVEAGAVLGVKGTLFADLVDADTDELIARQRCAAGEAMLYLDPDVTHWLGFPPHQALLRGEDPPEAGVLLSKAIDCFDETERDRSHECVVRLRQCAECVMRPLVPA